MTNKLATTCAVATVLALIAGCGQECDTKPQKQPGQQATPQPPPAPKKTVDEKQTPDLTRTKATVGVGKKGRGYGTGPIVTPVAAYFSTKERLVFDVQVVHAMKMYRATHGHGPRTQEEFMKSIIKRNHITLPELPKGDRYVYDSKKQELMVEAAGPPAGSTLPRRGKIPAPDGR